MQTKMDASGTSFPITLALVPRVPLGPSQGCCFCTEWQGSPASFFCSLCYFDSTCWARSCCSDPQLLEGKHLTNEFTLRCTAGKGKSVGLQQTHWGSGLGSTIDAQRRVTQEGYWISQRHAFCICVKGQTQACKEDARTKSEAQIQYSVNSKTLLLLSHIQTYTSQEALPFKLDKTKRARFNREQWISKRRI